MRKIHIAFIVLILAACSAPHDKSAVVSNQEESKRKTEWAEKQIKLREQKEAEDFTKSLTSSGCREASLDISKKYFSAAMEYYKTSPNSITESADTWNQVSSRACVSGYDAGRSGANIEGIKEMVSQYSTAIDNPFQYNAIIDSAVYGYKSGIESIK